MTRTNVKAPLITARVADSDPMPSPDAAAIMSEPIPAPIPTRIAQITALFLSVNMPNHLCRADNPYIVF